MKQPNNARPLQLPAHDDWRRSNTGRLLFNAARRFEEGILHIINDKGFPKVRMAHLAVPRNMDLDGTRVTTLATRASMTKQSMADLVVQCERMGLVTRRPDPSDHRARIILFTPKGRRLMEVVRQAIATMEQEMQDQLGAMTYKQIRIGLVLYQEDRQEAGKSRRVGS